VDHTDEEQATYKKSKSELDAVVKREQMPWQRKESESTGAEKKAADEKEKANKENQAKPKTGHVGRRERAPALMRGGIYPGSEALSMTATRRD
jgi:2-oxoglutarate dehydrogenase complex dehydrogenase (E1) component-like enzyme